MLKIFFRPNRDMEGLRNKRPGKDAGEDLFMSKTKWFLPFQTRTVALNIHTHTHEHTFGLLTSRSGNSSRGWLVHSGVIDHGYSGQFSASITNLSFLPRKIVAGERPAQLITIPFIALKEEEEHQTLESFEARVRTLTSSDRGNQSHNSSGR